MSINAPGKTQKLASLPLSHALEAGVEPFEVRVDDRILQVDIRDALQVDIRDARTYAHNGKNF